MKYFQWSWADSKYYEVDGEPLSIPEWIDGPNNFFIYEMDRQWQVVESTSGLPCGWNYTKESAKQSAIKMLTWTNSIAVSRQMIQNHIAKHGRPPQAKGL